jgi:hypothetical protein
MIMMMMQGYCLEVSFQLRHAYGRIIITAQKLVDKLVKLRNSSILV